VELEDMGRKIALTDSPSILAELETEIAPVTAMLAQYLPGNDGDLHCP
jgi:hypothetical protein